MKLESYYLQKWHSVDHKGLTYAIRSTPDHPYTSIEGYKTLNQQWMSLLIAHNHVSHVERVPKIKYFHEIGEYFFCQNWHDVDRNKLTYYDIRSPSNHPYTFGKGYDGLKQQWMSLIIAQYPTSCVERVTKIWYFVSNWRAVFGRNDTVLTIMLSYMLPYQNHPLSS